MTDLSATLSSVLIEKHSSKSVIGRKRDLSDNLDSFLKEAYNINKSISSLLRYLRALRTPYLSTAPPPRHQRRPGALSPSTGTSLQDGDVPEHLDDAQREKIDTDTSSVLREINNSITNLSSAVNLQHETATKIIEKKYGRPSGVLWRWAAGDGDVPDAGKTDQQLEEEGQVRTLKMFREGVLWYLGMRLKDVVTVQQDMVEKRLERERQKQMSVLYDPRNKSVRASTRIEPVTATPDRLPKRDMRGHDEYKPWTDASQGGTEQELSPEQLQLFEEENRGLFEHFNDQLAKVTQAEKSLIEISSLQQTLVGHLSVQGEMIGNLVNDAAGTDENVRRGNRELKKASERGSTARLVFFATAGFCSFLVVWDLIF
ncbi:syntaxin ufe1 [Elasticomyces elasticus]|uniref:Syntaxin ufe1 n=1 Tax=Exophiala sideris TaxID=1016849 RepID=A0ABR0J1I8_9EURO|nr:syntaxin ufe1 [Elasticomyces elasticus]KAK5024377.1 syntaxin ufe1 [Exophiala sideris]KAK5030941.1 syntaxin ufe1 [Exophiala sideris]KAK5054110.1 syntaxin ufe1 [Exophiala sideris]KAK5179534.1 syntaxin ufe1 [Eurotiomycetes sp. CCFEE 6388]